MSERIVAATIADFFLQAGDRWSSRPAFATKNSNSFFEKVSYAQWRERFSTLAEALIDLGVLPREHVGIFSDNCFQWMLVHAAIQCTGAASVPRGSDITPAEIIYILNHARVALLFVESKSLLEKIISRRDQLPLLKTIILMKSSQEACCTKSITLLTLQQLEDQGVSLKKNGSNMMEQRVALLRENDLSTLIYTSGTTGTPKGVQLTHRSLSSQIENITFSFSHQERALSLLPIWHSYELIFELLLLSHGATLYYTSVKNLSADLQAVQPTVMASAPRLWELLYERMMTSIKKENQLVQFLFHLALGSSGLVRSALRYFRGEKLLLSKPSWKEEQLHKVLHLFGWILGILPFLILDPLLLKKLRQALGGSFRATISGGGALPLYIDTFFSNIGIRIFEGYGLTESSPVLAVRRENHFIIGTVGPPLPKTEIRILDLATGKILYPDISHDHLGRGRCGEIYARGPQIMKGYYQDPEETARVLQEGWLRTGDLGMMTWNDCLKIIGRVKETIVLRSGENVEPLPIESRLLESPFIEQCMVLGQDQKQLGALLLPCLSAFVAEGFQVTSAEELLQEKKVRLLLQAEIKRLISQEYGFKSFERISCFELLSKPFEVGEELTATYKLKRHFILERYEDLIKKMYG